jgi:hypothetical protein
MLVPKHNLLATVIGPPSAAAAGYLAGQCLSPAAVSGFTALAALTAIVLAVVALYRPGERPAGGALLVYVALATIADPFAWSGAQENAVPGLLWIVPAAGGAVAFPPRRWWLTSVGCWAVLFAVTAALTYSCTHWGSGIGLFYRWLS